MTGFAHPFNFYGYVLLDCSRYRLAPAHHFPVPFEDVYRVVKHFLQQGVLDQYSVDPERVAVSGDSAGGNLAAAVSQQVPVTA